MAHGADNVLGDFKDNLNLVISQIKDGETERKNKGDFNPKQYWSNMEAVFKSLSHEATKLSLAFASPPLPDEKACRSLLESFEKVALSLVSLFYSLPKSEGLCLRKSVKSAVLDILEDILSLVGVLTNGGSGSPDQLTSTGVVWQDTDRFSKIPKDNKEAALMVLTMSSDLVRDALTEMQEAVENETVNDMAEVFGIDMEDPSNADIWTESDKSLLGPCLGLLKTSRSLLKKSRETTKARGKCDQAENVSQLDDLADHIGHLSPAVDEFAASLYPPMNYPTIQSNAKDLYNLQGTILDFIRRSHMCCEDDQKWIEFLLKANQHNWENIKQATDGMADNVT